MRSKLFILSTYSSFSCNSNYTYTYTWSLTKTDTAELIDLTLNPTSTKSELVMPAYTLAYGFYEFRFQVDLLSPEYGTLSNAALTYIQIVPTGVAVFGIENGVSAQMIGAQQAFALNPAAYSVDMDFIISASTLTYVFYCNAINLTQATSASASPSLDASLEQYKANSQLVMNWPQTCFSSSSTHTFNFDLKLRLNTL